MNIAACEDLATKAELQELRNQINQLLGQPENPEDAPIDVLQAGTMVGTSIGAGLFVDMEVIKNTATGATEVFKKGIDGVSKKVGGATSGMSKIANNASNGIKGAGQALAANAGALIQIASIGMSVMNYLTILQLQNRLDQNDKSLFQWQAAYNDVYNHLVSANDDLDQAQSNIDNLENDISAIQLDTQALEQEVINQDSAVNALQDNLDLQTENVETLKGNIQTLKTDLDNLAEFSTEEIEILKANIETLQQNVEIAEENGEEYLSVAQRLAEELAKLQGDFVEQQDRFTNFSALQSLNRAEIIKLQQDLAEERDLTDAQVAALGGRIRVLEEETRRKGGVGGIPIGVQSSIANQQNSLVDLASTLAGNPATVTDEETNTEIPVTSDATYSDIVNQQTDFSSIFNGLLSGIPDLTNLTIDENMVTQQQLDTSLSLQKDNIALDTETIVSGLLGSLVLPALGLISSQTSSEAIVVATKEGICQETNAPTGCLNTGLKKPLEDKIDILDDVADTVLDVIETQQTDDIINKIDDIQDTLDEAWDSTTADKALNAINTALALHNAMMLSRDSANSIEEVTSVFFNLIEVRDSNNQPINLDQFVGDKFIQVENTIFGTENVLAINNAFNSANRILTAAQGIASAARGIKDAIQEGQEIIANRVGDLGNSFMEQGILEENSFSWMDNNVDLKSPFSNFISKVDNIQELTDEINNLVQSGIELQENVNQIFANNNLLITASQELQDSLSQFDLTKQAEEDQAEIDNASPEIANTDLIQSVE